MQLCRAASQLGAGLAPSPPTASPPWFLSCAALLVALAAVSFLALRPGRGWLRHGRATVPDLEQPHAGLHGGSSKGSLEPGFTKPGSSRGTPSPATLSPASTGLGDALAVAAAAGTAAAALQPPDSPIARRADSGHTLSPLSSATPSASDPVLQYIDSHLTALREAAAANASLAPPGAAPAAGQQPRAGGGLQPRGSADQHLSPGPSWHSTASGHLSPEVQQWEAQWEDLKLENLIGKGAFGLVSAPGAVAACLPWGGAGQQGGRRCNGSGVWARGLW